ncbi:conserved oligomeric Golgi complex subunit 1 isoform X2 [Protopterus annectens]|uniref:conserved oligomeric Golgi complex subunit 1 isoform X2 n=1 Tax=Protopterus annectens TaxID=7888 RepID=UPI001CFAD0BD|nr:conserved oligomeric Golgi complex subunit 1 isoform X2 [Protopterus annectens]
MAAVPAQNLRVSEIRDPGSLFERYSVEEIRGIERRVRAEIEQKKEELRQMVGERYRDLIEAADTIWEMRQSSEQVVQAMQEMYQYCSSLRTQSKGAPAFEKKVENTLSQPKHQEKFYSTAAQIKLLLDIPERIWSSIESHQYLQATQLYLLCCHLHSLLQLDSTSSRYSPILLRFPILVRQVAAAGHFRSTILQESKSLLKGRAVSDQAIAEGLCSMMLLEGSSPRQALADFLLARKAAVQQLLNQPHHNAGIKAQVCSLVELLATTLYQAHVLFYTLPEGVIPDTTLGCGLLFSTLESVTGRLAPGKGIQVLKDELNTVSWVRHLPPSVMEFQPTLRTLAHPISQEYLRDTLQQWIDMCKEDIKVGIGNLLVYVKSFKGLAAIRDAVWELLTNDSVSQSWEVVCRRLLDKNISFWDDFLQQLFLDRLEALTKEGLESISRSSKQLLISALQELENLTSSGGGTGKNIHFEHNVASFLWMEGTNDLLPDTAWVSVASRSQFVKTGLSMKAQALTPCIQNFCTALDLKLKAQLNDLLSYLPPDLSTKETSEIMEIPIKHAAFDRYSDASTVEEMLRSHCVSCVHNILDCVKAELRTAESKILGHKCALNSCNLVSVLYMARLCQSLGELCPHLKQCILGQSGNVDLVVKESRISKKVGKGKVKEVNPAQAKWQEVKEHLLQQSLAAYRIWSTTVSKVLFCSFTQTLLSDTAGSVLSNATHWDEIEIQEETESGNTVTSKIRLPIQPSWYAQLILFSLCQEVNRVGGHALPKVTLQELLKSNLEEMIAGYEQVTTVVQEKKENAFPMTQNRALQLLFDLRYLYSVLSARNEEGKSSRSRQDTRIQKLMDMLESYIDPFDLDVFTPHLNANLNRLSQRTSVLFGLLTGTEKHYINRSSAFSSQESHNVLPLASSQIRFGLLPLSMSSSRKSKSAERSIEASKPEFQFY